MLSHFHADTGAPTPSQRCEAPRRPSTLRQCVPLAVLTVEEIGKALIDNWNADARLSRCYSVPLPKKWVTPFTHWTKNGTRVF